MKDLDPASEVHSPSVRTCLRAESGGATLCPVCRERPLTSAQTVCSTIVARQVRGGEAPMAAIKKPTPGPSCAGVA